MILAVMDAIYAIAYAEAWKPQDFNSVQTPWPRDTGGPSNQLSYEATDVGSWSFVGSIWNILYIEPTNDQLPTEDLLMFWNW